MSIWIWVGIALLGGAGAVLRFELDGLVQRITDEFPLGTLTVNAAGSLALGILVGARVGGDALLLAGTGLLGSFTTFSTWMLETQRLTEDGDERVAVWNVGLSLAVGLVAAGGGWAIGAQL